MTTLNAMTYIVGYLTSVAAVSYFIARVWEKPVAAERIAFWFFFLAMSAKAVAMAMDWYLR